MSFEHLGLSSGILKALQEQNYHTPTPIQAQAIPVVLQGRDLLASAQTGTGKTAGFTLPILQNLEHRERVGSGRVRALILSPTRELAAQIHDSLKTYSKYLKIRSAVVFGGVKINPQISILRGGVDILVATPGRLLDLHQQKAIRFDDIEVLVLDEADRMLDMGFIRDIRKLLALMPAKRQNLLFSATFSPEIQALAKGLLTDAAEVNVAPKQMTADRVAQTLYAVDKGQKTALLSHLIRENLWYQVLVFSRTKHGANKLVQLLERDGIQAAAIHGNKSQAQRTRVLQQFKQGTLQVLVATDIAARGIDIEQLPYVINYDLPDVPEDYVHRIGRTARAGAEGVAVSLVAADQTKQLRAIERMLKRKLPLTVVKGFEPSQAPDTGPQARTPQRRQPGAGTERPRRSGGPRSNSSGQRAGQNTSRTSQRSRQRSQQLQPA